MTWDEHLADDARRALDDAYDASHKLLVSLLGDEDSSQSVGHLQLRLEVLVSLGATRPGSVERRMMRVAR